MLDLIVTNNINSVLNKYVYNPHLSGHSYIECTLKFVRPKVPKKCMRFRIYKTLNILESMNLPKIEDDELPDGATSYTVSKLLDAFNKFAPFKNKTIFQYPSKKFISNSTKELIKTRDNAYKLYRHNRDQTSLVKFLLLKKKVGAAIYYDTKLEFSTKVEKLHLWGALNNYTHYLIPPPKSKLLLMK